MPDDLGRAAGGLRGDQGHGLHPDVLGSRRLTTSGTTSSPARQAVWTRSRREQFDAPQILEAFNRLKVFVDNGWVPDNEIELTWQQSVALFVAEQTAFYLNGAWTIGNEITGEGAAPDLKDHVAFAPFPAVGENGSTVEIKQTTGIGLSAALAEDEAKLEAAHHLLQVLVQRGGRQAVDPADALADGRQRRPERRSKGSIRCCSASSAPRTAPQTPYSLPGTQAMQERGWDDCATGLDTLLSGGSAEEAVEAYLQRDVEVHDGVDPVGRPARRLDRTLHGRRAHGSGRRAAAHTG